jgi:hypothetical protein
MVLVKLQIFWDWSVITDVSEEFTAYRKSLVALVARHDAESTPVRHVGNYLTAYTA